MLRFLLVDDDDSIRAILSNIIEEEELGTVEGEAMDGSEVTVDLLEVKQIDVLIIDLLMPNRDGIETIQEIGPSFKGKIIMLSQVETKDLIGEAYSLGIDYYITKPINRLEVVNILNKVKERILLENSIHVIQTSLNQLERPEKRNRPPMSDLDHLLTKCKYLLAELGIISESGYKDLLDIIEIIYESEENAERLSLNELFEKVSLKRYGNSQMNQKEIKSSLQRVRRAVHQSLEHVASLGVADYSNPTFEYYSSKFFDFEQVRMKMLDLQGKANLSRPIRINIKKYIHVLYMEATKIE